MVYRAQTVDDIGPAAIHIDAANSKGKPSVISASLRFSGSVVAAFQMKNSPSSNTKASQATGRLVQLANRFFLSVRWRAAYSAIVLLEHEVCRQVRKTIGKPKDHPPFGGVGGFSNCAATWYIPSLKNAASSMPS